MPDTSKSLSWLQTATVLPSPLRLGNANDQLGSGKRLIHVLGMIGPRRPSFVSARALASATVGQSSSSRPAIRRRAHGSSQPYVSAAHQ